MSFITVGKENSCDINLYYKDWGAGEPVVFCHGWPLNSDVWERQMLALNKEGFRTIAFDRRGFGLSTKVVSGFNMNQFADDLAVMIDSLNLSNVTLVGHSMAGGEVVRYLSRHGQEKVKKIVLIGSVTPQVMRSESNPNGAAREMFDEFRAGILNDRHQFFSEVSTPYFGAMSNGDEVSKGMREAYFQQTTKACLKGILECTHAFSETDFTEDLNAISLPTLIIHSESDQMVPFENSAKRTHQLIKNSELKVYQGGSHGLMHTHAELLNEDLLSFLSS